MAGGQERILRRRIRSVEATKKITRAMELIAASQIVRAQGRIAGSRPYLRAISEVVRETAAESGRDTRLLGTVEHPANVLVLAVVADRGLCGGYNSTVLRATERAVAAGEDESRQYRLVAVGRKAQGYFRFRQRALEASFTGMSDRPSYEDTRRVAATLVAPFLEGEVDLVQIVSTRFVSAGTQVVETRQLLPLLAMETVVAATPRRSPSLGTGDASATGEELGMAAPVAAGGFYEFEPDPADLLGLLVPRYAEAAVYGTLLEASASEHTARMRAMSAATENADDLITRLRRTMNRARQDSITTEIMEIVGGAEALRAAASTGKDVFNTMTAIEEQIQ